MSRPQPNPDVSICMVSLNCWNVLRDCLETLTKTPATYCMEVICVDNASSDGTPDLLAKHYPHVKVIRNTQNVGFTIATNQAIRASCGRHILWLNTDILVRPDTLPMLSQFLDEHPAAGIVGPQVLNLDGSFQPQCRRGIPTPWASLCYLLKLDWLFPQCPAFNQYLQSHLPIDRSARVDALSGCCLMAKREVWDQIGPLDESIFGFGEDIDWCVRAKNHGFEVWYHPAAVLVHLKGQGGVHSRPYHKAYGIQQCMWQFYRDHLSQRDPAMVRQMMWLAIKTYYGLNVAKIWTTIQVRGLRRWLGIPGDDRPRSGRAVLDAESNLMQGAKVLGLTQGAEDDQQGDVVRRAA